MKVTGEPARSSSPTDEAEVRVAVVPHPGTHIDIDTHEVLVIGARLMRLERPTLASMLTPPDPVYSDWDYMTMLDHHHPEYGRKFDLGYFVIAAVRQLWENLR